MKLYLEDDNGRRIEVTPVRELGEETDIIILMAKGNFLSYEMIQEEEEYYSRKLGKRVVIIGGMYRDIYGIKDKEPSPEEMVLHHE